jgi:uncharacterized membrane protein (UPF0182 family)
MKNNRALNAALIAALLIWFGFGTAVALTVDYLWFNALEHGDLFMTSLQAKIGLWTAAFVASMAVIGLNTRAAWRDGPINFGGLGGEGELRLPTAQIERMARQALIGLVLLLSLGFANGASRSWMDVLSYLEREPFNATDPIYGLDISFYFFELPVFELTHHLATGLCFVSLACVAGIHFFREQLRGPTRLSPDFERDPKILTIGPDVDVISQLSPQRRGLSDGARAHLLNLGGVFFVLLAVGFWLRRYDLLFTRRGAVFGVGYTDVNAQIPVLWIMIGVALLAAGAMVASIFRDGWRLPAWAVGGFFAASALLNGLYPPLVQKFFVTPNELEVERPYLEHNIQATREAFALERIAVQPFEAASDLTMDDIRDNPLTIQNVRLWDTGPLLTTYSQLQEIRLYYDFIDVDVDRYELDGKLRQVMLSGRELNYENIPSQAQSFVNERLQYTHGYGLTMSPVNVVTEEGLPDLFVKDIPPTSVHEALEVTRPEIYYGEQTDRFVMVKTTAEEFDHPLGDQNKYTRYAGDGGVSIGSLGARALFSAYFQSFDILLSSYLTEESRVLFRRRIKDRVRTLVPFLSYDSDPYLVVEGGRLYWILDAYTVSHRYPYSEQHKNRFGDRVNYIRNSVKVVIDAYHGSVDFYIADPEDPVIRTYARIFSTTFKPLEQMPAGLVDHLRYPVDFFEVQADLYRAYHMVDTTVFYNKEDMWEFPMELYGGRAQTMRSYYLIMKLPDAEREEFVLLLPFVPTNRDNMISWLAARSDGENYGELLLYQFPKQKLIYGPRQIEARIDQDPEISEQITLWSQSGSRVVRGNLLVIPIGDSLMYVEPLYLQAESSQLPELKRVLVSYENRIAMRQTLNEALQAVFGGEPDVARDRARAAADAAVGGGERGGDRASGASDAGDSADTGAGDGAVPAGWQRLVDRANRQFMESEDALRAGDWAGYGEAQERLRATLEQLGGLAIDEASSEEVPLEEAPPEDAGE